MKVHLDVKDSDERNAVLRAWSDPVVRATVIIAGHLMPHSKQTRQRIVNYVTDHFEEEAQKKE